MCVRVEIVGDTTTLSLRKLQLESNTVAMGICVCVRGALLRCWGDEGDLCCPGVPRLVLTLKRTHRPENRRFGRAKKYRGRHGCGEGEE